MQYPDNAQTKQANLRYVRTAMEAPMLEREHELRLARLWKEKGDEKALHELISSYTRLVVAIAAKFKNYGLPVADLIQEGNIGLMEAAARFEPEMGNRFSTYATWWVRAQIQDYVLRNWSIVRTGTTASQKALFFNLRRLRAKIANRATGDTLDEAGIDEIARALKVSSMEVIEMEHRLNRGDQSLSAPIGENGENAWQDMMPDTAPTPEDVVLGMRDNLTRSRWLNEALGALSPREQTIIRERQMNETVVTLEDLGRQMGISKERVRQLEQRAMSKLKNCMLVKARDAGLEKDALFM